MCWWIGFPLLVQRIWICGGRWLCPHQFCCEQDRFHSQIFNSTVDDNGLLIVRSPDALRPLTLCNCDCKIITTAICFGLHRYSIWCIHPAQRCVSTRQMTDNIFEMEATALAHFACATRDSGILLTDFACAYPSVNHSWIFHVLEKAELPRFIQQFLRMIHNNSVTDVEIAGKTRRQFLMSRCVRQGCPASGFSFDPIFRRLHGSIIRRNPADPELLQPVPRAYADDFAVAAPTFRSLMPALSPAFLAVDSIAGLNLNHRKCFWVQYGNDRFQELLDWVSTNCGEFREMKIVKYAKHVSTMIGAEGHLHGWTAPRQNHSKG